MNNSSVNIGDYTLSEGFETANTVILSVMLVACVFGNVLVIIAIGRTKKLRTSSNFLVINLSLCDMINAIAAIPFTLVWNRVYGFSTFPYGEFGCKLLWPLATYAKTCSVFTLAAIAVDCFLNISYMNVIITKKKLFIALCALHILAVVVVVPYTVSLTYTVNGTQADCYEIWDPTWQKDAYTISLFVIQYGIPLSIMSCFYSLAWYRLYRRNKVVIEMSEEYEKKMEWSESGSVHSSDTDSSNGSHDMGRISNGFLKPSPITSKKLVTRKSSVLSERVNCRLLENETPYMRSRPRVIERKITRRKESLAYQRVQTQLSPIDGGYERTLLKNLRNIHEEENEREKEVKADSNHIKKQRNSCSLNSRNSNSSNYEGKYRNSCGGKNRRTLSVDHDVRNGNLYESCYPNKHRNSSSINHHRGSYNISNHQKGRCAYSNNIPHKTRRRSSTKFIDEYRKSKETKKMRFKTFFLSIKTKIKNANSYYSSTNHDYNQNETRIVKKFRNSSFLSQTSFIRHRQTVKILKMFTIVVIIFMCFELPNQLAWLISDHLPSVLIRVLMVLTFISSVVNCWIYGSFHTGIRKAYFQLLCCFKNTSRSDHTSTVSAPSMYDCHMQRVVLERNTSFNQMFEDAFTNYDSNVGFNGQKVDNL